MWIPSRCVWAWAASLPLALAGCGGGGGGGGGGTAQQLGLGFLGSDPVTYSATPTNDARLTFGTGSGHLPLRAELRDQLPPVDSQLYAGSCVGWSVAYYLKSAVERKEVGWDLTSGHTNHFSPAFVYNQRPHREPRSNPDLNDPDGTGGGMQPEDAMNILVNLGCCRWPSMPYSYGDSHTQPSTAARNDAANFKARDYRRFGSYETLTNAVIDEMKGWLNDEGTPITIAIDWWETMHTYRGADNGVVMNAAGGGRLGGHMITIVGYDDNIPYSGTGSFLLVNSHGLGWGVDGFAWVPYQQMKAIYIVGFGVLDLPNGGGGPTPPPPQSNDTIAGAGVVLAGSTTAGSIGGFAVDPADWFQFSAASGDMVTLRITGLSTDADMKLTDASENRLASSELPASSDEEIVYTVSAAGTYYVKVYPYDDAQSGYSLSLAVASGQTNDVTAGATVATRNANNTGSVGGADPRDWWRVDLPAGQQVHLRLADLSDDLDVYVYRQGDIGGDWWLRSWNAGSSDESIVFTAPSTGTYYVLCLPYGAAYSTYTLRVDDQTDADLRLDSWNVTFWDYSDRVDVHVNSLKVTNVGPSNSGPFTVGVAVSNGTVSGSLFWLGSQTWVENTGLPSGWNDTWSSGDGTVTTTGISPGWYYLLFRADSGNAIAEANEHDNFAFSANAVVLVP